jgi:hypothetical protein
MAGPPFSNPFTPGAGHPPPYLAGREPEKQEFQRLLQQDQILQNLVLTGLRGIGKTVLLDELRRMTQQSGWLWAGADLSESASVSEESLATRIITDLAVVTGGITVSTPRKRTGFATQAARQESRLDFEALRRLYANAPGLVSDRLRHVLEAAWRIIASLQPPIRGVVFAYDEAQNLADHAVKEQFPLSVLLEIFQSIQRKGVRLMLVLTGLPTLFPKLVDARTYAERMFRVLFLKRLDDSHARDAILKPIANTGCPVKLNEQSVSTIVEQSSGYPYFIQFICREVYDQFLINHQRTGQYGTVPVDEITHKLDGDFFAGRWSKVTDRQRELLRLIAGINDTDDDDEFTVQEIVEASKKLSGKPFSSSHVNQMLSALASAGLVYKNRHGKYSFAVPLFGQFVLRQMPPAPSRQMALKLPTE